MTQAADAAVIAALESAGEPIPAHRIARMTRRSLIVIYGILVHLEASGQAEIVVDWTTHKATWTRKVGC